MNRSPDRGSSDFMIKADKRHAQLLLQTSMKSELEDARRIIEGAGARVVEATDLKLGWVLIRLDVMDMREIVLKLTERGFLNIRGVNASDTSTQEIR